MPTIGRVVHIGSDAHLSYADLQLVVRRDGQPEARVPLEDLAVVVCDYGSVTMTEPLLAAFGEAGIALIACGARHLPSALLLPMAGASLHTRTLQGQVAASLPRKKRLWQRIVSAKISAQAALLVRRTGSDHGLHTMARRVGSGDPQNLEGQAARIYFRALFGAEFQRNPDLGGVNAMLNYGYAVLRAAVARAVVGAGLHPALGLHHRNQYDAFTLADDLMEPLRPLVDDHVLDVATKHCVTDPLSTPVRADLLQVLTFDVAYGGKRYPLFAALEMYAARARECILGEERRLECPVP